MHLPELGVADTSSLKARGEGNIVWLKEEFLTPCQVILSELLSTGSLDLLLCNQGLTAFSPCFPNLAALYISNTMLP